MQHALTYGPSFYLYFICFSLLVDGYDMFNDKDHEYIDTKLTPIFTFMRFCEAKFDRNGAGKMLLVRLLELLPKLELGLLGITQKFFTLIF